MLVHRKCGKIGKGKIRIAYLIDTIYSDKAGTEKQLIEIARRLDRDAFDPYLVCLRNSSWLNENKFPCEVFILGCSGFVKASLVVAIKRLLRFIATNQLQIIQTFFEDAIFIGVIGKMLSPTNPVLLSSRRDLGLGNDEPWYHVFYRAFLPLVNRKFDGVVTNAHAIKKHVLAREKVSVHKIKVINNGIDLVPANARMRPPIFTKYKPDLWIGIVANLKYIKRIDLFLRAIDYLREISDELDFHAVILGEGNERHRLTELSDELGISNRIHFMGAVGNVIDYLRNIDIGVLCSDKEGFSNAILEYMACGLPVIATTTGGNTELVDETNGICVTPDDYVALAEAIKQLAESKELRKQMGAKSLQKVKENFTWDKIISQWENYYRSLVCNRI